MKYLKSKAAKWIMFTHAALMYIVFIASPAKSPDIFTDWYAFLTLVSSYLTVSYVRDEDLDKEIELLNGE